MLRDDLHIVVYAKFFFKVPAEKSFFGVSMA